MVGRQKGSLARRVARVIVIALAASAVVSCDFFSSPIAGFLNGIVASVDIEVASIIEEFDPNDVRYDLAFVTNNTTDLLLLRVTPTNTDPDSFEDLTRVIVMDQDATEIVRVRPEPATLDYLTRPYGLALNDNLLIGYSVYDLSGADPSPEPAVEVAPHGLEGFVISDPPGADPDETYLFAPVSGAFSSFHLELRSYESAAPPDWAFTVAFEPEQVNIIADGTTQSADLTLVQLGYQLLGITYDGIDVRFLLSRPSEQIVIGATAPLTGILDGTITELISEDDPVDFSISADRPRAVADEEGFFLLRRNGRFERYNWDGDLVAEVSGDISFSVYYAFDGPGNRAYRYDPGTSTLSIYDGWW